MRIIIKLACVSLLGLSLLGCSDGNDNDNSATVPPDDAAVFKCRQRLFRDYA